MIGHAWEKAVAAWLRAGQVYRRDTGEALRGLTCHYCGDAAEALDHVIPRVAGGPDTTDNLVPACRSCNGAKSGHSLEEWARLLRAEVRRAEKRRRALRTVEAMLATYAEPGPELTPEDEAEFDRALERAA